MRIVIESGIPYKANPMGTVLEGEWDEVMSVIRVCHEEALVDADRVVTEIKIDDYRGRPGRLEQKLESVEEKLGRKLNR
jgi:uncharacterized protein (TIGR00106 family)